MLSGRFHTALRRVLRHTSSATPPTHPPCSAIVKTLEPVLSLHRAPSSPPPPPPPSPFPRSTTSTYGVCAGRRTSKAGSDPTGTKCSPPPPPPSTPPALWSPPPLRYGLTARGLPAGGDQVLRNHLRPSALRSCWSPASWRTTRGYCDAAQVPDEKPIIQPFKVTWRDSLSYFSDKQCPKLLVQVPDSSDELYKLLKSNPKEPQLLSEPGKVIIRSLIEPVLHCHSQDRCLGASLSMENLMVSSLGTLKLREIITADLTEEARRSDLKAVSKLIVKLLKLRHGSESTSKLPKGLVVLLGKLNDHNTAPYLIKNDPALLPATMYPVAYLKLYGLMRDGLMKSDKKAASQILTSRTLPYQTSKDSWIDIVTNNTMLASWMSSKGTGSKKKVFTLTNTSHQLDYGRNVFSHALEKKTEAATFLGVTNTDYIPEAVGLLHYHSFPKLLSTLQRELFKYYSKSNKIHVMNALRFEELYPGVPAWTLHDEAVSS